MFPSLADLGPLQHAAEVHYTAIAGGPSGLASDHLFRFSLYVLRLALACMNRPSQVMDGCLEARNPIKATHEAVHVIVAFVFEYRSM